MIKALVNLSNIVGQKGQMETIFSWDNLPKKKERKQNIKNNFGDAPAVPIMVVT